ncbi:MAG: lysostaphin resistance A-like protein [Chitinophagales bacterium]
MNTTKNTLDTKEASLIKWPLLRSFIYLVCFFITLIAVRIFFIAIASILTKEDPLMIQEKLDSTSEPIWLMFFYLTATIGILSITWFFRTYIDRKSFKSLGFEWQGEQKKDAIVAFFLGLALIVVGFILFLGLGLVSITAITFAPKILLTYVVILICVSLVEEVSIRGYVLKNLLEATDKYVALVITASCFGLLHIANPNVNMLSMLNIFLAGILLGLYYIYRQNLWFPIALHFSWNFFQGPVFGFEVSGIELNSLITQKISGSTWLTGGDFGLEGSALLSVLLLFAIFFVEYKYGKKRIDLT